MDSKQGCKERLDRFRPPQPWSAVRLSDYGYTRLSIHNGTHLSIEQISDDQAIPGSIVVLHLLISLIISRAAPSSTRLRSCSRGTGLALNRIGLHDNKR